ncbi:hypothetical protein [Paenibacillus konkukensis]|uniref:hypothetical protein n=1 Tax=Paenibacillus konkukensis TaxID=2020716 RepID=UPI00201E3C77|nr:hypothetical protein [Paenibacillus konkukensis]
MKAAAQATSSMKTIVVVSIRISPYLVFCQYFSCPVFPKSAFPHVSIYTSQVASASDSARRFNHPIETAY